MLLAGHFQNAYVTRDRDRAVEQLRKQYGVEEFLTFDPDMEITTPAGRARSVVRVALGWIGSYQIEVIEPVSGMVDVYLDYLPEDDSLRFHHICLRTDDWDPVRSEIDRRGWTVVYEGDVGGMKFAYVDARESLGHYLEYAWATPETWKAQGWRGTSDRASPFD